MCNGLVERQRPGFQRQVILDKALGAFAQRPEIFLSQLKLIQPVIVRKENVPHRLQYRRTEQDRRTQILRRTAVRTEKTALFHGEIEPFW